ncbi:MAG: ribonuclease HII [Verrucomicrobiota bacterium]|nr:ribonuclease HII [Limisphaera sp.]MDW8382423.1 ribonuclease HII [Verrucomicrobiota bacterium]
MARRTPIPTLDRIQVELALWARGAVRIAGVDEAGRGPLAGPVVAAAVILPSRWWQTGQVDPALAGLNDSKQLTAAAREAFYETLVSHAEISWAVGMASVEEIDQFNILQATYRAMQRAVAGLQSPPDHVLVDGRPVPCFNVPSTALVRGDGRSLSIGAASIIAKVTRDRLMGQLDRQYPGYGFAIHKGYPTPQHLEAIRRLGPSPVHRVSFAPVRSSSPESGS